MVIVKLPLLLALVLTVMVLAMITDLPEEANKLLVRSSESISSIGTLTFWFCAEVLAVLITALVLPVLSKVRTAPPLVRKLEDLPVALAFKVPRVRFESKVKFLLPVKFNVKVAVPPTPSAIAPLAQLLGVLQSPLPLRIQ